MPATPVIVPPLGDSISEVTVLKWYKNTGEKVAVDEPLIEAETDKSNVDIPASVAGVVTQLVKAGDVIKIGQAIANVDPAGVASGKPAGSTANPQAGQSAGQSSASAAQASAPTKTSQPPSPPLAGSQGNQASTDDLSPAVRRLVEENKLDAKAIPATGPGGRLTKEDVVNHIDAKQSPRAEDVEPLQAAPAAPAATTATDGVRKTPLSKIRKKIAENLVRAQQTAAILTTFNEVDLSAVMAMRTKYKDKFEKSNGVGLGFMSFFSKAACRALKEFPRVNGQLEGDNLVTFDYVNLGIAVSTDRGLAVPVLRHAQNMSFAKIESEIKRLATAVRDGKLGVQEMSGGTFTITNGGVFGSLLSTPIINPPQSAILGMHTIQKRAVVIDDKLEIRPMMYLALSYDHRVIDGKESVSFLVRIKELLEDPSRLLLEV